jgi:GT2 family glycosyltransferase
MADFDIIIVNYESSPLAIGCIGSIYQQIAENQVSIWVIDNGSSDGPEQIRKMFPGVYLCKNKKNTGFAAAVNQGIVMGRAPHILLINPDATIEKGVFQRATQYLKTYPDIGILGPRILNADGSIQASARSFPTPLTAIFGRQSLFTRLFPNNRFTKANLLADDIIENKNPATVDWVSGACMLVRRKAVEEVGFLDDAFFMYWEDADWCRRIWRNGWKVIYYPGAVVIHTAGESSRKNHLRASLEFHRSAFRLYRKHQPQTAGFWWPVIAGALYARFIMVSGIHLLRQLTDLFLKERA